MLGNEWRLGPVEAVRLLSHSVSTDWIVMIISCNFFFFFCFFCCRLLQCGNDAPALVAVRGKSCAACDGVATAAMIFESAAESQ